MTKEYLPGQMDMSEIPGFEYFDNEQSVSVMAMVKDFADVMGQRVNCCKGLDLSEWPEEVLNDEGMREKLIREEFREFSEACANEFKEATSEDLLKELSDLEATSEDLLKELSDLVYVIYGYAAFRGWDLDEAVCRVHENNMERCVWPDGTIRKRDDGKVMKNPDAPKVQLSDLV
jgi:predicted HAD superfamily Cof-like phosphohydrolase